MREGASKRASEQASCKGEQSGKSTIQLLYSTVIQVYKWQAKVRSKETHSQSSTMSRGIQTKRTRAFEPLEVRYSCHGLVYFVSKRFLTSINIQQQCPTKDTRFFLDNRFLDWFWTSMLALDGEYYEHRAVVAPLGTSFARLLWPCTAIEATQRPFQRIEHLRNAGNAATKNDKQTAKMTCFVCYLSLE